LKRFDARWPKIVPTVPTNLSNETKPILNQQNNGWNGRSNFSNFVQNIAHLVGTVFYGILAFLPLICAFNPGDLDKLLPQSNFLKIVLFQDFTLKPFG
jgi:hypothetical protein